MRKLTRALGRHWLSIGASLVATAALALSVPPVFQPRAFNTQQTHYERHVVTLTSVGCQADSGGLGLTSTWAAGGGAACNVKVGAVPYNAYLLRGTWFQGTACNATTTCTMSIGTASGGAQLVSAQDVKTAATGTPALTIVTAGQGAQALGNGIAQTGTDGGFDLWVNFTETGGVPSAGTIVFELEYIGPNDGGCVPYVPMGTTSPAC